MIDVRDALELLRIEPKKSLGQNFMVEPLALEAMADAAEVGPGDAVLEVGAGLGALTEVLAERARRVVALEVDGRMIPYVRDVFAEHEHVAIVDQDVLTVDIRELLGADAALYKVVANVPYYITTAIIRHLLENPHPPQVMVITIQREVAARIMAKPGDMSILAVSVQFFGVPSVVRNVGPSSFYPQPKVGSSIVKIKPHAGGPPLPLNEIPAFFRVVRAGFSQPRKQIKNPLAAGLHVERDTAVSWLEEAGIDPRRRPEKLSVAQWVALYKAARPDLNTPQ